MLHTSRANSDTPTTCETCGCLLRGRKEQFCSLACVHTGRRRAAERSLNTQAFDVWTPEMAYALGLFFADGCLTRASTGSWRVVFTNTDLPTVEWWHAFLGNPNKLHVHEPGEQRRLRAFNSITTSDTLGERLFALGAVPRKSVEPIRVPPVPDEVLGHFLRGFCDGDGSVGLRRRKTTMGGRLLVCTLACNSVSFRADLRDLLAARGIKASEHRIQLTMSGSDAERFCELIYGGGGPAMVRKGAAWEDWKSFRAGFGGLIHLADPKRLRARPWHQLLGTAPDADIARQVGLTEAGVRRARTRLGIPVFAQAEPAWHALAGKFSDDEVARIGGTHKSCVCAYRRKLGIPSYRSQLKKVS